MDSWIKLEDFEFHKGDIGGLWEAIRESYKGGAEDALRWNTIKLPHCYNNYDALDPDEYYYQGPAWYRKKIIIKNPYKRGNTFLYFEGVGQKCDIYLDNKHIFNHIGGYDEFKINISSYLKENQSNYNLIIRCDNSRDVNTIPSDLSDFNIYGGIYREAYIIYEGKTYIEQLHLSPIFDYKNKKGTLTVCTKFNNKIASCDIEISKENKEPFILINKETNSNIINLDIDIDNISPWSPFLPSLYNFKITWIEDNITFSKKESFGFRFFEFKKHGPFYLNGERLLLKGTHRHEDHSAFGSAQPISSIKEEMNLIKEMGANFIRLGHYQQNKEVLKLCDELGILVWEEIPWCRGGLGGEDYKKMGKRLLKHMIHQHFNHPSIIIWGLGNENDWSGDFSTFSKENIREYMKELNTLAHKLDKERKTAIRRCDFAKDIVDVYSPSIWAGWYRGHYREYKENTLKEIKRVNHFLHVEWGADSHLNRFSENPYLGLENLKTGIGCDERENEASLYGGINRVSKDGNWSENYACDLFDWTLKEQLDMPELSGTAFWPFKDFSTPLRCDNPIPYVNQKGAVQRDLTKKEVFYVIQAYWSESPMLRLFGHNWKIRWGDENEVKEFRVYSNCKKVEFFLDGKSLGIKDRDERNFPSLGLRWKENLSSGTHIVKAIAYLKKEILEDSYEFLYTSRKWREPAFIKSKYIKSCDNKLLWEIEVLDSENNICLDFEKKVRFSASGISPLIINMGTSTGSKLIECSNGRANIELKNISSPAIISAYIEGLPLCSEVFPPKEIK